MGEDGNEKILEREHAFQTNYRDNEIGEYEGKGEGQILLTGLGQILHPKDDSSLKKSVNQFLDIVNL
jgi:hypothetical protein